MKRFLEQVKESNEDDEMNKLNNIGDILMYDDVIYLIMGDHVPEQQDSALCTGS